MCTQASILLREFLEGVVVKLVSPGACLDLSARPSEGEPLLCEPLSLRYIWYQLAIVVVIGIENGQKHEVLLDQPGMRGPCV